jgi:hypothetical protein
LFVPTEGITGIVDRRGAVVSDLDIPGCCVFGNANLLTAHMFHALTLSQSMHDLAVNTSKGTTIATLLDAEFPRLRGDGERIDKLISFKTVEYVQANIFLCAPKDTLRGELFERARTFQDSLENTYKDVHRSTGGILNSAYRHDLQKVLTEYYEEVLNMKGAGGAAKPRELKFRRSVDPAPPLAEGDRDPTPPPDAEADPPPAAGADPPPAAPERVAPSPAKAGKGRKPKQ